MKLVAFSPWHNTTTCIPSSKEGIDTIVPNLIIPPSNTTNSNNQQVSKKRKKSRKDIKNKASLSPVDASDVQPVLSVTSNHQLCVLGHHHDNTDQHKNATSSSNSPKKILRQPSSSLQNDEVNLKLKQVSQWIYNSRPDPTSSFFPKKNAKSDDNMKNHRKIGAVIDPLSRSIFVLQNNNQTLKVWNLDDDVNGPDDNYYNEKDDKNSRKMIQSVEFDSPVMSMDMIPIKQRQVRRVKIKGTMKHDGDDERMNDNGKSDANIVVKGGVTGILSNGQMFVLLVCSDNGSSANYVKLGLYGAKTNVKKRGTSEKDTSGFIYSMVGFTSITNANNAKSTMITSPGQKRKLDIDMNDDANSGWGEISLSVVSRKTNSQETSLILTKHYVTISSLKTIANELINDDIALEMIGGVYESHEHHIDLPNCAHDTKKNGHKNKDIFVTQLDPTHIGVAYHTIDKNFCATIIDTKAGDCILNPITLRRSMATTKTAVTDVGGLSSSILAVLTSDAILSLYDLRRAVKLHELNIRDTLGTQDNGVKYQYKISTHWYTGTICILCNATGGTNGSSKVNNVSICSARVGVYDSEALDVVETGRKPFVKGQYNLARIIASSMATESNSISQSKQVEVNQVSSDMMQWLPSTSSPAKKSSKSFDTIVNDIITKLEHYRDGNTKHKNGSKQKSLVETFEEIKKKLQEPNSKSSKSTENRSLIKVMRNFPQAVIDVSVSVAISIILSKTTTNTEHKSDAAKVLIQCIKSGLVSGRNHFDKAIHSNHKNDDTLRSLLFTLQSQSKDDDKEATPNHCSPLDLISNLLQYCKDGLTEQMLVSMTHFVLCHVTEDQFSQHWEQPQTSSNEWYYSDSIVKVLEKRLCKARDEKNKNSKSRSSRRNSKKNNENDVQKLVNDLETRLAVSRQLHFIEKIVTHSKCNPALLRMALQSGLTQAEVGEVGVLIQALGKILRRAGKEKKDKSSLSSDEGDGDDNDNDFDCTEMTLTTVTPNKSTCISQWLSALIDANLATLIRTDESRTMQQVQKEVSASIAQTKAILSLKELLCQVDSMIDSKTKNNSGTTSSTKMEVVSLPLYGIEQLIF